MQQSNFALVKDRALVAEKDNWLETIHKHSHLRHDFLASEVRIAYLAMERAFKKHVYKSIAPTHGTLLILIDEYPNSTQQQLSEIIGLQRSTMVRTIDEFEKKGWVKRHKKENDRRSFAIRTTPKGSELVAKIKPEVLNLEEHVIESIGRENKEVMMKLLREFQHALWDY